MMNFQSPITIEEAARAFEQMLAEYDELEMEAQGRPEVLQQIAHGRADIERKMSNLVNYIQSLSN